MTSSIRHLVIRPGATLTAVAATLGLLFALVGGTHPGTAAAASFTWSGVTGVPATPPENAGGEPHASFAWGACPTAQSCVGVGSYTDASGNEEPMAAVRAGGSWEQASEIELPEDAATSNQEARFWLDGATVACTAPGACVAVGHYIAESGGVRAMGVTETGGTWGEASDITPLNASNDPSAYLRTVACTSTGSCAAGGEYENEDGDGAAMIAQETNGSWSPAREIQAPASDASDPEARIYSIACPAAGSCVAFGRYQDGATGTEEAMVATETAGTWNRASRITPPANAGSTPRSTLGSVVCTASEACVAVGGYTDEHGDREAMVAEENGGLWGQASEIAPPANAAANPQVSFDFLSYTGSIACPAAGSCVIAGEYTDGSGDGEAMVAEQTGGSWGQAREIAAPANAAANPSAFIKPACPTSGSCVAVGDYEDEAGDREAMVAEQTGGSWSQASELTPPANAASNPKLAFGEVDCPASWSCVAFGDYQNDAGATEDMEATGTMEPAHTVTPVAPVQAGETPHEQQTAIEQPQEQVKVAASSVSLAGSTIHVQGNGRGSVKLTCTGTATCTGTLTLTVKRKAKKGKTTTETIGTVPFSIHAGRTTAITLALTATGRAVLKAGHGRLTATLAILESPPSPTGTRHDSVQLVREQPTKANKPSG